MKYFTEQHVLQLSLSLSFSLSFMTFHVYFSPCQFTVISLISCIALQNFSLFSLVIIFLALFQLLFTLLHLQSQTSSSSSSPLLLLSLFLQPFASLDISHICVMTSPSQCVESRPRQVGSQAPTLFTVMLIRSRSNAFIIREVTCISLVARCQAKTKTTQKTTLSLCNDQWPQILTLFQIVHPRPIFQCVEV